MEVMNPGVCCRGCLKSLLRDLLSQLRSLKRTRPTHRHIIRQGEAEDPACIPIFWISKWVDYSDKYGLGYVLCDNSVGVLFNDKTRLVLYDDGDTLQYVNRAKAEFLLNLRNYPSALSKKITLLKYFRNYMSEHLLKAGANITPRDGDELTRLPLLNSWFRTKSAIVFHLSNGTVQVNFQDHTKVILSPRTGAVTYVNERGEFRMYRLSLLEKFGCSRELAGRLRFAHKMVEKLLANPWSMKR